MGINYFLAAALVLVPVTLLLLIVHRNKVHRAAAYGVRSFGRAGSKLAGMMPWKKKNPPAKTEDAAHDHSHDHPPKKSAGYHMRYWILVLALLLAVILYWYIILDDRPKEESKTEQPKEHSVKKYTAEFGPEGIYIPNENLAIEDALKVHSVTGKDGNDKASITYVYHRSGIVDTFGPGRNNPEVVDADVYRYKLISIDKEPTTIIYSVIKGN